MIASYQTSGSTSCYVIKGYYRHNSPMSFSSSWLLENDTTSKICSYCCIICALFTINHTVYTGSSSVSQCTSRIQSNTTSDVTTAPSFSHFIWSSAHFFFFSFFGTLSFTFTFRPPFCLPRSSPISYRIFICVIFPFHNQY